MLWQLAWVVPLAGAAVSCTCVIDHDELVTHCADGRWLWYAKETAGEQWAHHERSFARYQQARAAYDEHVEHARQRESERRVRRAG